jgi:hypothetical protein
MGFDRKRTFPGKMHYLIKNTMATDTITTTATTTTSTNDNNNNNGDIVHRKINLNLKSRYF